MFDVANFMNTFDGKGLNGYDSMIMQSAKNVSAVTKTYYNLSYQKIPLAAVLDMLGLDEKDFMPADYKQLQEWVANVLK